MLLLFRDFFLICRFSTARTFTSFVCLQHFILLVRFYKESKMPAAAEKAM